MPLKEGHCIFCGRKGNLTKEHIWSDWLGDELRNTDFFTRGFEDNPHKGGAFNKRKSTPLEERKGSIHKQKVRKVCVGCNTTWMSQAVDDAKGIALRLVRGEVPVLNEKDQKALALWIAICAVVLDARLPERCKLTQSQRDEVRTKRAPMDACYISLGRFDYAPPEEIIADRCFLRLYQEGQEEDCISSLAYTIKNLFAHIVIVRGIPNAHKALKPTIPELVQIYPPEQKSMAIENLPLISYECADEISRGLIIAIQNELSKRGFILKRE